MKDRKQEFKGWLWFNGSNADMDYQLNHTGKNSGVGIDVRKNKGYFSKQNSPVELIFDDKNHGLAITNKNSWDKCPHLIQECIGLWARKNGLWAQRLKQSKIQIKIEVLQPYRRFLISKYAEEG